MCPQMGGQRPTVSRQTKTDRHSFM